MTVTGDRVWFRDADGVWHRQGYANIAVCGALADRRAPWVAYPPDHTIMCADCDD